jgi:hypothetical protein
MKTTNGIHVEYSPINAAWFVMWFNQVLSVHQRKSDALAEATRLTRT